MHFVREKNLTNLRELELKTKSMTEEGGNYSNELKYLINAETQINSIDVVNQFETGLD